MNTPPNPRPKADANDDVEIPETLEELDLTEIDAKSASYLRVLDDQGGSASTSELRDRVGFTQSAVHYRHEKLEELGLVELERPEDKYDGKSAITASLTPLGVDVVDGKHLPGERPGASLERLEKRVEGLRGSMKSERERLERRIDDVESTTLEIGEFAEQSLRRELEVHRSAISHLLDRVDELEGGDQDARDDAGTLDAECSANGVGRDVVDAVDDRDVERDAPRPE